MVFKYDNGGGKMSVKEVGRQLEESKMNYKINDLELTVPRIIKSVDPNDDRLIGEMYSDKKK